MTWLVAGLGNPDDRYARTRHNLGVMVVEELTRDAGGRLRSVRFVPVEAAEIRIGDEQVLLARSRRYMNESGPSFAQFASKRRVNPDHVIAVHDELDLPVGTIRVKVGGSTAGHQGLRSLQGALRTPDFYRVRLGIGRPPGRQDPADFVLEPLPARMQADVAILVGEGAEAVRCLVESGLAAAQDRFNRRPSGD